MPNLIVHHIDASEQHWYMFGTDELPGLCVHIMVFLVRGSQLVFSLDVRKHLEAETIFKTELLRMERGSYLAKMDGLEQDRELLRQEIDEEGPPPPPPSSNPSPPTGYV